MDEPGVGEEWNRGWRRAWGRRDGGGEPEGVGGREVRGPEGWARGGLEEPWVGEGVEEGSWEGWDGAGEGEGGGEH